VSTIRQKFVEGGMEAALERKKQHKPLRKRLLDGEKEAQLIAIACGKAPEGRAKWTLELLANELIVLKVVDSISDQTVRRTLKKMNCVPTCANAG
jgi:transposase